MKQMRDCLTCASLRGFFCFSHFGALKKLFHLSISEEKNPKSRNQKKTNKKKFKKKKGITVSLIIDAGLSFQLAVS